MTLIAEIRTVAADISSSGGGMQGWTLVLAAMLALLAFSFALARRARERAAASDEAMRQRIAELRGTAGRRESVAADPRVGRPPPERAHSFDDLLVQLEDVSRRINAQLDTKFVRLETVIRDADDRLSRAEAVLARLAQATSQASAAHVAADPRASRPSDDGAAPAPLAPQRPPPAAQPKRAANADPMNMATGLRADRPPESSSSQSGAAEPRVQPQRCGDQSPCRPSDGSDRRLVGRMHPPEPHASQPPASPLDPLPPAAPLPDPRVQRIYELADQGLPPIKIAAALDVSLGEVEFALNLRKFG